MKNRRLNRTVRPTKRAQLGLHLECLEDRRVLTTITGEVVNDLNANGVPDAGEPGQALVAVYADVNNNGELDQFGSAVEPDDFQPGQPIDGSAAGVALSIVGPDLQVLDSKMPIRANADSRAATGDLVFGYNEAVSFSSFQRLKMDFDSPISSISLQFIGQRAFEGDIGRLEVYDSSDNLLERYRTSELISGKVELMEITRAGADIAYALAYTELEGITGRLDSLRINGAGSEPSTLSRSDGTYQLGVPGGGTYTVREVVPDGFDQTAPAAGSHNVVVAEGATAGGFDFANNQPVNVAPVANNDQVGTSGVININVVANDTDSDGQIDVTSVEIIDTPANGTATVETGTGRVRYEPNRLFNGTDIFTYIVRDNQGLASNVAEVTVEVSGNVSGWQNQIDPFDVAGDGDVVPFDALLIINELNRPQYRDPITGLLPPPPDPVPFFFDVDGDGFATPTDAILVINFLNSLANGGGANAAIAAAIDADDDQAGGKRRG